MIVFISDLHFEDGSAGKHNVSRDAFGIFFEELRWHVQRRGVSGLRIVLLGDIFDLLRTDYWFGVDPDERPWGAPSKRGEPLESHARKVLGRIAQANGPTFAAFRTCVQSLRELPLDVTVTYVPGNHDRLLNRFASARDDVGRILGITPGREPFSERFQCPRHGVLATHGHQFDTYNHETASEANPDGVPIGDPLTTELITRIPTYVAAAVRRADPSLPESEVECIQRTFESLEDVRPMSAIVEWLLSQVGNRPDLERAIHQGLDDALASFRRVPFVQQWFELHDGWKPNDDADRLQLLLWLAGHMPLKSARKLAPPLFRLRDVMAGPDPYTEAAQRLLQDTSVETQFVVMGHTHSARQDAMGMCAGPDGRPLRRVYLNTGTWRPCHHRCADGTGFLAWKEMTYTMLYAPQERSGHGAPSFETWSGTLDARGMVPCH